jgi:hypothetical protein
VPYERLGIFIALIQVVQHRFLQCSNRHVASAPHASFGHFRKQSFHVLIDITSALQAWLNGSQANNGIALVGNSPLNASFHSKGSRAARGMLLSRRRTPFQLMNR